MRTLQILFGASWIALWPALGCGGRTLSTDTEGDTGPLATCGDNCSPVQIAASCAGICDKLAQLPCYSPSRNDCTSSCPDLASMTGSCVQTVSAALRCLEAAVPECSNGDEPFGTQCGPEQSALEGCLNGGRSSTPTAPGAGPPGGVSGNVPDNVCPNIPRPVDNGLGCSGYAGTATGLGPNTTTLMCGASCQDSANNVWEASCTGSTCTCTFNGGQACTCAMTESGTAASGSSGGCVTCCPGTN